MALGYQLVQGTIIAISNKKNQYGQPTYICIKFDSDNVGLAYMLKTPPPQGIIPFSVKLLPSSQSYEENTLEYMRYQFPVKLAFA